MNKVPKDEHSEEWYVWSVRPGKFSLVEKFIEEKVPEIKKVLYPTVTTEKQTKRGAVKTKQSPLYAGYLFLQYSHDSENPSTWLKLNKHPFIAGYVGPCSKKDLATVNNLQGAPNPSPTKTDSFQERDEVQVRRGVFKGYTGVVNKKVTGNFVSVELKQGQDILAVVFSPEDLDLLQRGDQTE